MDQDNKRLLTEFPPVTTAEWEEILFQDLKGADYQKKLIWKTIEGFDIKPYYREEDIKGLPYIRSNPAEFPNVRGYKKKLNKWQIRCDIDESDPVKANKSALGYIASGADSIGFRAKELILKEQMSALLKNIDISKNNIHFTSVNCLKDISELFTNYINTAYHGNKGIRGSFNFDPLAFLLLNNKFYGNLEKIFKESVPYLKTLSETIPDFKKITINGHYYHNSGASIVQEVAFTLAHADEYLSLLTDEGFNVDEVSPMLQFSMATGSNFFMEIAKFRALRMLWANMVLHYKPANDDAAVMFIHASTSLWNKTIYDAHVNILRNTTEAMSAILGSVDSLNILPYDVVFTKPGELSSRIARNTQLILKEESYLGNIVDPSAGSYYIECITDTIARESWKLFQKVEEDGGFIQAVKSGFISAEIQKTRQQRDLDIAMRRTTLLGTNQYPNLKENALDKIQTMDEEPVSAEKNGLKIYRGAEVFEEIRLEVELYKKQTGKIPSIFLFATGNLGMRKARASFITNFFGCAGYRIIDSSGYNDLHEGIKGAVISKAPVVVICSSDEEYETVSPVIAKGIKDKNPETIIIVAGYPKDFIDTLQNQGVDDFIHMRSNVTETLKKYNRQLLR